MRPFQLTTNHAVGVASHKGCGPPRHVRGVRFCAGPQRHGGHKRPAPHGADHVQLVVCPPHVPRNVVHGLGDGEHRRAVFAQGFWIKQPCGDGGKHGVVEAQRVFASVLPDEVGGVRAWACLVEVECPGWQIPVVQKGVFLQVQRHASDTFPTQRRRGGFQLSLGQRQDVHGDGLRFRLTPVDGGRGDVVARACHVQERRIPHFPCRTPPLCGQRLQRERLARAHFEGADHRLALQREADLGDGLEQHVDLQGGLAPLDGGDHFVNARLGRHGCQAFHAVPGHGGFWGRRGGELGFGAAAHHKVGVHQQFKLRPWRIGDVDRTRGGAALVVGAKQLVRARLGDGQLRLSIVRPHGRGGGGERLCRQHQLVAEAHFPGPFRSSRDGLGVGGVVGFHQAKALLVAHGTPRGCHEPPMHERVATKKRGDDVACVGEPEVAVEIHLQGLRVGIPHNTEREILAVFNVGQRVVRLHRAFHVVKNGPVAGQRDVVEPRVTHVRILPRVHLHRQRRVEWAILVPDGPPCGSDDVVAHAEGLKDKDNAVRAVRVGGPEVHREFEVEVSFQVELTIVPCAAPLVL